MIVLAQRWMTQDVVEALVLAPAEDWNAWQTGVLVYEPAKGGIETADPERARFIGAGDLLTEIRMAVHEVAKWTLAPGEVATIGAFAARIETFLRHMEAAVAATGLRPTGALVV